MPARFLPVSKAEMQKLGWQQPDIIIVSGDAYIDHPAFAAAVIGRWLEYCGYKVAILPQPDWTDPKSFTILGKPRLFFGITSGNMDSMINKYTAQKKLRSADAYSPDGAINRRPDRAALVYSQIIHSLYKDIPIVIGGLEASMRRLPHYDHWSEKVRNSLLFDSRASCLIYGMGEKAIREFAAAIERGQKPLSIRGSVVITSQKPDNSVALPAYHKKFTKEEFRIMHLKYEKHYRDSVVTQEFAGRWLKFNPPAQSLTTKEMDIVYDLPFTRAPHPVYGKAKIAAFEQIKNSVTSHRGCFGGCSFCGIGYHQGKTIQSRSAQSIIKELKKITKSTGFHGTISDVGGPSANMYGMYCKLGISETCKRTSCLYPEICPNLKTDHQPLMKLLNRAASLPEIKHLFVASGIRFDLALQDVKYIREIARRYTSGLLKLAPEHKNQKILHLMNKPAFKLYQDFLHYFWDFSQKAGKKQSVVPYIIIGHPGETLSDTIELAKFLKKENVKLKQVQEYIPLPMTSSALMYYTGKDLNGKIIHVARGRELRLMKALVQWFEPQNKKLIIEALTKAGKRNLISYFVN